MDVVVAITVGLTWGALSIVFFAQPEYGDPVRLLDNLAVILFSAALGALAPAAWLIAKEAGRAETTHRPTAIAAVATGTIFGALTLSDGGFVVAIATWLVAGAVIGLGPSAVIRAAAAILAVSGPLGGFGNLIEDGLGVKNPGATLYIMGAGGSVVGLLGLIVALALGRRLALAALCAATLVGVFSSTQYGGGLIVLVVWLLFAAWLWLRRRRPSDRLEGLEGLAAVPAVEE